MPQTIIHPVVSLEGTNFTEALAGAAGVGVGPFNATAMNNIPMGLPWGNRRYLIRSILVMTLQNFGPEINFFASALGNTADPATDFFLGRFGFTSSMGEQIGNPAAGCFRYYVDGLAIPYHDRDTANSTTPPSLHIVMQNIDTVAKSAAAAGNVVVRIGLEPQQAW